MSGISPRASGELELRRASSSAPPKSSWISSRKRTTARRRGPRCGSRRSARRARRARGAGDELRRRDLDDDPRIVLLGEALREAMDDAGLADAGRPDQAGAVAVALGEHVERRVESRRRARRPGRSVARSPRARGCGRSRRGPASPQRRGRRSKWTRRGRGSASRTSLNPRPSPSPNLSPEPKD